MSGSTPESGEFAARLRLGLGLAFTTVPLAKESARYYREQAAAAGWSPGPAEVIYRSQVFVGESDERARAAVSPYVLTPRGRASAAPVRDILAGSGYFGREAATHAQRELARSPHSLDEQIELGEIVVGSPASVVAQLQRIRDEVGAGIVDLVFQAGALPFTMAMESLELFGREVLPKVHEL